MLYALGSSHEMHPGVVDVTFDGTYFDGRSDA